VKITFSNWRSALQRYWSLTAHKEFEAISPTRSLPVPFQYLAFFAAKTPKRSFGGDNLFCLWRSALQRFQS